MEWQTHSVYQKKTVGRIRFTLYAIGAYIYITMLWMMSILLCQIPIIYGYEKIEVLSS